MASFSVVENPTGETVVSIAGELDISNLPDLADRVQAALAKSPTRMVVDVGGVSFADSSAISLWLQWSMAVPEFELRDPPVLLRAVITTMGLGEQLGMGQ
ncbi:MAG TPA: STAS domain-containing protein [Solirubrobacteraceae bacterium]|nr:STAS domain-containing protein [Solirubrobacteraceae bacterium]